MAILTETTAPAIHRHLIIPTEATTTTILIPIRFITHTTITTTEIIITTALLMAAIQTTINITSRIIKITPITLTVITITETIITSIQRIPSGLILSVRRLISPESEPHNSYHE